jgi:hypothetical protein
MRNENPLEQEILDRFFKNLTESEDFPQETVGRLLRLRKEDSLRNREKVYQELKLEKKTND